MAQPRTSALAGIACSIPRAPLASVTRYRVSAARHPDYITPIMPDARADSKAGLAELNGDPERVHLLARLPLLTRGGLPAGRWDKTRLARVMTSSRCARFPAARAARAGSGCSERPRHHFSITVSDLGAQGERAPTRLPCAATVRTASAQPVLDWMFCAAPPVI
jgi:hypothetical protein